MDTLISQRAVLQISRKYYQWRLNPRLLTFLPGREDSQKGSFVQVMKWLDMWKWTKKLAKLLRHEWFIMH